MIYIENIISRNRGIDSYRNMSSSVTGRLVTTSGEYEYRVQSKRRMTMPRRNNRIKGPERSIKRGSKKALRD